MRLLFIIGLLLSTVPLFAQEEIAAPKPEKELLTSRLRKKIKSFSNVEADSLKPAVTDSLSQKSKSSVASLKSLKDSVNVTSLQDSVSSLVKNPLDSVNQKVGGVKSVLQQRSDSIQSLAGSLTIKVEGVGEQVNSKAGEAQEKVSEAEEKLNESISKVEQKIGDIENKATSAITDRTSKVESQLNRVTGEQLKLPDVQEKLDLPKVEFPKEALPALKTDVPNLNLQQNDLNLDPSLKTNIPAVDGSAISNLGEKANVPGTNTSSLGELDKVGEIGGQIKDIDQNLAVAEEYEKELQKIKEGDLTEMEKIPGEAEKQIGQLDQVKGLSDEINKASAQQAQYEAMIKKYQDKKLLQEEMMRKVANVANDELAKHAAQVQQAQNKLSKAKRGVGQIKSVKDIFKVKSDELVGKKFYERLVPGLTTQVYNKDYFQMDIALQLGYRFMPRVTAGVGATYRVGFDKKFDYFVHNEEVYGGRTYLDFAIKSGIFLHGEFEALKFRPQQSAVTPTLKESAPKAVYGSYFGIGKRFNISRQIRANVTTLYRVEYEGKLPSMSKLNIRMGFDYMFGNRRRKFNTIKS